jgi:hypothetical protein
VWFRGEYLKPQSLQIFKRNGFDYILYFWTGFTGYTGFLFRLWRVTKKQFLLFFFFRVIPCFSVVNILIFNHGFFTELHRDIIPPAAENKKYF